MTSTTTFSKIVPEAEALEAMEEFKRVMYGIADGSIETPYSFCRFGVFFTNITAITQVAIDVAPEIDLLDYPQYRGRKDLALIEFSYVYTYPGVACEKQTLKLQLNHEDYGRTAAVISDRLCPPQATFPSRGPLIIPGVMQLSQDIRVTAFRSDFPCAFLQSGQWEGLATVEIDYVPA